MKKYRLKDRELQKKLDEISLGDFSPRLQDAWSTNEGRSVATFCFGDYPRDYSIWRKFTATICEEEIEAIPEYDPTKWNYWPDVEPPYDVPLRVELVKRTDDKVVVTDRGCASYRPGIWKGMKIPTWITGGIRFRPWIDEGEAK